MVRSYYSASIEDFLSEDPISINKTLEHNSEYQITREQDLAWEETVKILKDQLQGIHEGRILLEYTIPRMGKRVDVVLLHNNIVFVIEFKCWDDDYSTQTENQVIGYVQDLKCFQKESEDKLLIPIIVPTEATTDRSEDNKSKILSNKDLTTIYCNKYNLRTNIDMITSIKSGRYSFDYNQWEESEYFPVPTIVEAAQALYKNHSVTEITRHDANIDDASQRVDEIIRYSKEHNRKSICFITGVPGAGKTLVGLNIAINHSNSKTEDRAAYLSGNGPLVEVLQNALKRDKSPRVKHKNDESDDKEKSNVTKNDTYFIEPIHRFRKDYLEIETNVPPEHVVIFDEAQRAWNREKMTSFAKRKKLDREKQHNSSEPEALIGIMNRHTTWATIICLVGGGQEIYNGEAGIKEWFDSLRRSYCNWDVYITPELNDSEYCRGASWEEIIQGLNVNLDSDLHLKTSIRSFRTPNLSSFVKNLLDVNVTAAQNDLQNMSKYPIYITRDLNAAKKWIKENSIGNSRHGIIASSKGLRLKPEGIFVKNEKNIVEWFLGEKTNVLSSFFMEEVATEFDIQGLEIDYAIVAWDADLRFNSKSRKWEYYTFRGSRWLKIHNNIDQQYLLNAYRVLLTRSRQGMVIFVPEGNDSDETRKIDYYDGVYNYLLELGLKSIL